MLLQVCSVILLLVKVARPLPRGGGALRGVLVLLRGKDRLGGEGREGRGLLLWQLGLPLEFAHQLLQEKVHFYVVLLELFVFC